MNDNALLMENERLKRELAEARECVGFLAANAAAALREPTLTEVWPEAKLDSPLWNILRRTYTTRVVRQFLEAGYEGYEAWRNQMLMQRAKLMKLPTDVPPEIVATALKDGCDYCGHGQKHSCEKCGAPA